MESNGGMGGLDETVFGHGSNCIFNILHSVRMIPCSLLRRKGFRTGVKFIFQEAFLWKF